MQNHKRKVVIVANTTWNIYNFRQNIIQKLLKENTELYILAPIDQYIEYKEKYPTVTHINLRSLDRDSTNPFKDLILIEELRRKYKKIQPDLIIHYTHKPNIFGTIAAKLSGYKSVSVITGLGYSFINKGFTNVITKLLYRLTSNLNTKMIFENEDDKNLFVNEGLLKKEKAFSVKGCGVDIGYFSPVNKTSDVTTFTFVGRLLIDKGIVEFAEAASIIKEKYQNVNFVVIGDFDEENPSTIDRDQLLKWIDDNTIDYRGFVNDIRDHMANSSCIVLPSYREGMPRVVLEAMAMSKPIITTNTAGCRETVEEGKNGFLVDIKSVGSLVEGLEKFLTLDVEVINKMGKYSRLKVENEFEDSIIADHFYSIISPI